MKIKKTVLKKVLLSLMVLGSIWFGMTENNLKNQILTLLKPATTTNPDSLNGYKIVSLSDGDTIDVDMNGKTETIRFLGIDTPETHHPDKGAQCFGPEASAKTKELLDSGRVKLAADSKAKNRDKYGRLLRYVYTENGQNVEEVLLKGGYAFVFRGENFDNKSNYLKLEKNAKQSGAGLWSKCAVNESSYGSMSTNGL